MVVDVFEDEFAVADVLEDTVLVVDVFEGIVLAADGLEDSVAVVDVFGGVVVVVDEFEDVAHNDPGVFKRRPKLLKFKIQFCLSQRQQRLRIKHDPAGGNRFTYESAERAPAPTKAEEEKKNQLSQYHHHNSKTSLIENILIEKKG